MIQLTEILANGLPQPILLKVNSFNYMENKSKGYGSIVYYGIGCIEVTESVKQINHLITTDMKTNEFIRVRNTDVLELIYKGHEIYDEDMELLDYGTDRIQPDMVYVTPCTENNDEKGTQIMCINHDTKMTQIITMKTNEFTKLLKMYYDAKNDIFAINDSYYDIMTYDIDGWSNHIEDNDATPEDYEQLKAQVKAVQDLFSALRRLDYRFS